MCGRGLRGAPATEGRRVSGATNRRRVIASVILWWAVLTLVLWLLSRASSQPAGLAGCAASAVLLVAVGEAGDWLRCRWHASRRGRSARLPRA
jgi:hypothetical protein